MIARLGILLLSFKPIENEYRMDFSPILVEEKATNYGVIPCKIQIIVVNIT